MTFLTPAEAALVDEVRAALAAVLPLLGPLEATDEAERRLRDALASLDQLFLLVVAGEFNAGKTAVINALLGGHYLEEGVTPTTREIHLVTFGELASAVRPDGVRVVAVPAATLAGWSIVDTPGTNAIVREHEALTRDFIPRADLVLFVTSADRPFTESERSFLEAIRAWRKKVVFVINKIDLIESEAARAEVVRFVTDGVTAELGEPPPLFAVSARRALAALEADDEPGLEAAGWAALQGWLTEKLSARERLRLKLESPLGVADRIADDLEQAAAGRLEVLRADGTVVDELTDGLAAYEASMRGALDNGTQRVELTLARMRERGEEFLDERVRLTRLRGLLDRESLERDFVREVVGDAPDEIERGVAELIDGMIDLEHDQWRKLHDGLAERSPSGPETAPGSFAARRKALLDTVGREAHTALGGFDPAAAGRRLSSEVQEAVTRTAVVEVGAVGLGLVLKALLVTAAADATGILFAGVVAVLGLTIIPHRRRQAVATLRERTTQLRAELTAGLEETFEAELSASLASMHATVDPYAAFVARETDRVESAAISLAGARQDCHELAERIHAAPEVVTEN